MLLFHIPSISTKPVHISLNDINPAPELTEREGIYPFWYGDTFLLLIPHADGASVYFIPPHDNIDNADVKKGKCSLDTAEDMICYFYSYCTDEELQMIG